MGLWWRNRQGKRLSPLRSWVQISVWTRYTHVRRVSLRSAKSRGFSPGTPVSSHLKCWHGLVEDQDRYSANPYIVAVLRNIGSWAASFPIQLAQLHGSKDDEHLPTLLYFTLRYFTLLYFTLLYFTLLYFTLLYFTLLYFTLLYFTLLCFTLLYIALHCFTLLYFALRCVALRCVALRCVALRCVALLCFALLCFALLYFTLHCIALLCIALLCIALLCFTLLYFTLLYFTLLNRSRVVDFGLRGDKERSRCVGGFLVSRKVSSDIHTWRSFSTRTGRITAFLPNWQDSNSGRNCG